MGVTTLYIKNCKVFVSISPKRNIFREYTNETKIVHYKKNSMNMHKNVHSQKSLVLILKLDDFYSEF